MSEQASEDSELRLEARRELVSGKELQKAIVGEARRLRWRVAHFYPRPVTQQGRTRFVTPASADGKGWPDLFLVRDRGLAIEVKGDGDRLTPDQRDWIAAFRMAGIEAIVATPLMWQAGAVTEILERRGPPPAQELVVQEPLLADVIRRGG